MISFETKMNPETGLWQYRKVGAIWSKPVSLVRCMVEMRKATLAADEPKQWGLPAAPAVKRSQSQDATTLYEIRGGKVQRIAANTAERRQQQIDEILALMGDEA